MIDEIQVHEAKHPELWDADRQMTRLAANGMPIRTTIDQAMSILARMFVMFPKVEMSEVAIQQYIRLLQDIPPEALQRAVDEALLESEWLPTIALIRKLYGAANERKKLYLVVDEEEDREIPLGAKMYKKTKAERGEQLRRWKTRIGK